MTEPFDDRIRRVVREIGEASPEPPPLSTFSSSSGRAYKALNRWRVVGAAAGAFAVVAAIGVVAWLLRGPVDDQSLTPSSSVPSASSIPVLYQSYTYSQSAALTCEGGELTESGEFDSMTIEVWADLTGRRFRQQATYPDGTTRDVIAIGHPSLPRKSFARGEPLGRRVECSTSGILLFDPTDTIGVLLFNSPIEEPGAMDYTELGTLVAGDHTDSLGRPVDLYQETIDGFVGGGDGADQPIEQITEWYVEPDRDRLVEVRFHQDIDGNSSYSRITTLIEQEEVAVEESFFDPEGYTLIWSESDYSEGIAVEGQEIEPRTRLGPEWIWPEFPDPAEPTVLASRFANEVLGWEEATTVADPQAEPGAPTVVTIDNGSGRSLIFFTFPIEDRWAANQIGQGGVSLGVGAEATVKVWVTPADGSTSAVVLVGTADDTVSWQALLAPGVTEIVLPGIAFDEIRTVLILYADDSEQVIEAAGGSFFP